MTITASNTPGRGKLPRTGKAAPAAKPLDPFAGLRSPYEPRPDAVPQPKQAAGGVRGPGAEPLKPKQFLPSREAAAQQAARRRDAQGRFSAADPFRAALEHAAQSSSIEGALGLEQGNSLGADAASPENASQGAEAVEDNPGTAGNTGFGGGVQSASVPAGESFDESVRRAAGL